ncbi:hypothetical protein MRB53_037365 [Persea americana]|nr:hypothetical protein MRB53_037365 [Persea americana]
MRQSSQAPIEALSTSAHIRAIFQPVPPSSSHASPTSPQTEQESFVQHTHRAGSADSHRAPQLGSQEAITNERLELSNADLDRSSTPTPTRTYESSHLDSQSTAETALASSPLHRDDDRSYIHPAIARQEAATFQHSTQ